MGYTKIKPDRRILFSSYSSWETPDASPNNGILFSIWIKVIKYYSTYLITVIGNHDAWNRAFGMRPSDMNQSKC